MSKQEEINKRLLTIKELAQLAKDDPELEIFERIIYKKNKKENTKELRYELPWRSFLMPLIHLIQNETEVTHNFWKVMHRWFFQKRIPLQSLGLEDITFILSSLDKTNTKKSRKVLEKFKKFTLVNELLDEASPFISSDLMIKGSSNPAFETNDADISEFIESSSYILLKAIISSYGIDEIERVTDTENLPDFDSMKILDKHNLVKVDKKSYKDIYDSTKDWQRQEAKGIEDHWFVSTPMEFGAMSELSKFPSMEDFDEILGLHYSYRLMGSTNFDIYLLCLDYLQKLLSSRKKLLSKLKRNKSISIQELAYVSGSRNTRTIRNEFFKKDNQLIYVPKSKILIKTPSAQKWIKHPKRKQPIYFPIKSLALPDITLDYIMEL